MGDIRIEIGDQATSAQLIEQGVGLIARGMYRLGDKDVENKPREAYDAGMAAVSTIREMAFSFLRLAKGAGGDSNG